MTRTVCPNCGAPWEGYKPIFPTGSEMALGVFLQHDVSACCGCSAEYLEKIESAPDAAWSVKLAEYEHAARLGLGRREVAGPAPDVDRRVAAHLQLVHHVALAASRATLLASHLLPIRCVAAGHRRLPFVRACPGRFSIPWARSPKPGEKPVVRFSPGWRVRAPSPPGPGPGASCASGPAPSSSRRSSRRSAGPSTGPGGARASRSRSSARGLRR